MPTFTQEEIQSEITRRGLRLPTSAPTPAPSFGRETQGPPVSLASPEVREREISRFFVGAPASVGTFGESITPPSGVTPTGIVSVPVPKQPAFTEPRLPTQPPRQFTGVIDEFGRALARGSLNVGSGLLKVFADTGRDSIFDVEKATELADTAKEASRAPRFQPGKDAGVQGFVANAVGEAIPFMASVIAATLTTGPVGG